MDFRTWAIGKADKATYVKSITVPAVVLLVGINCAMLLTQLPFSFFTVDISKLGEQTTNPMGWMFFTLGFVLSGIFIIPHSMFFYNTLLPDSKGLSRASGAFILVGGIGLIFVGLFPWSFSHDLHIAGAVMAFGGVGASCAVTLPILLKRRAKKVDWPRTWHIVVIAGGLIIWGFLAIAFLLIPRVLDLIAGINNPNTGLVAWPPIEWLLLATTSEFVVSFVFLSPNQRVT